MEVDQQVPQRLQQEDFLRQSVQEVRAQRLQLVEALQQPTPSRYLVVAGSRLAVPFATRVFDQEPALRLGQKLGWAPWQRALRAHLRALGAWVAQDPRAAGRAWRGSLLRLQQKERWRTLWARGNFQRCAQPRSQKGPGAVNAVVLHWDMCNSSAQALAVLQARGLSAHLLVDEDGTVLQLLDLADEVAFHAGWINARSVGVEINNPIDPRLAASTGAGRALVQAQLAHTGEQGQHLDFTAAQKTVVVQLVQFLCTHLGVPQALPASIDAQGHEAQPGLVGQDFAGVCGHYHVGAHKADPGATLWPLLQASFAQADTNRGL